MADMDLELKKEFDLALSKSDKRMLKQTLKRALVGDADAYGLVERYNNQSHWDLTKDEEARVIEALGKRGISTAMSQKILDAFHKAQHESENLLDQNEIELPKPGIVIWDNETAAAEGAELSGGVFDRTANPAAPAFQSTPGGRGEFDDETPAKKHGPELKPV